jgi:hypothetical protein
VEQYPAKNANSPLAYGETHRIEIAAWQPKMARPVIPMASFPKCSLAA